jgi:hypothetical protein
MNETVVLTCTPPEPSAHLNREIRDLLERYQAACDYKGSFLMVGNLQLSHRPDRGFLYLGKAIIANCCPLARRPKEVCQSFLSVVVIQHSAPILNILFTDSHQKQGRESLGVNLGFWRVSVCAEPVSVE